MGISEEVLVPKATRGVKGLKETEAFQGSQVSLGPWATLARKDQKDKRAALEIPAWKDP